MSYSVFLGAPLIPLPPKAADEKRVAERKWQEPAKAPAPQRPCDIGLFSDDSKQGDLF